MKASVAFYKKKTTQTYMLVKPSYWQRWRAIDKYEPMCKSRWWMEPQTMEADDGADDENGSRHLAKMKAIIFVVRLVVQRNGYFLRYL